MLGRELVHRFSDALPAKEVSTSGCAIGDIVCWTPSNALAIFYNKTDESIDDLQYVGRIDSGADGLSGCGDGDVTFNVRSESARGRSDAPYSLRRCLGRRRTAGGRRQWPQLSARGAAGPGAR